MFVSTGANRQQRKSDGSVPSSGLPVPDRKKLPMNLLIAEPYFDDLFKLLEQLSDVSLCLENVVSHLVLNILKKLQVIYMLIESIYRPATHTDFICIYRFFTLRIWQNTDFLPQNLAKYRFLQECETFFFIFSLVIQIFYLEY